MELTRRAFLKSSTAAAAGLFVSSVLGNMSAFADSDKTDEEKIDYASMVAETTDCDVVIIGSGAAGMCAAVEAAQCGASVIVLEKAGFLGGNTNFAEGVFGAGSSIQKEMGIEVDTKALLQRELEFQNYKINRLLMEDMIRSSGENVEWLISLGVQFLTVTSTGDGAPTWHLYTGDYEHGSNLIHALEEFAKDFPIQIMKETPAKEIIMQEGKVAGLYAERKDHSILKVNAKAVVIASGGFAGNTDMVNERVCVDTKKLYYRGMATNTGDGIRMSDAVGGTTTKEATVAMIGATVPNTGITSFVNACGAMEPTNVWVNQDGVRFFNEEGTNHYTRSTNAIQTQERVFSVLDKKTIDRCSTSGCITGFGAYVFPGTVMEGLQEEFDKQLASNTDCVFCADTLEELAEKIGVQADTFVATIGEYNDYCKAGVDSYLNKPADYLIPVNEAPYYACRIKANSLNTMGGIKVNLNSEVMDSDYMPIPGLYAAGMDVDGFSGETYGIILPGTDQGIAVYTGRNAGKKSAEYVLG